MTSVASWNIQFGKGIDGRVDLGRIRDVLERWGLADVICLQEVSDGFSDLDEGIGLDQPAALAELFPGYRPVFRPAIEWFDEPGNRRRFGNMILSRLPVLEIASHLLPRPAEIRATHMRRQVLEVVVAAAGGPLRVATTHLEYYSVGQRKAQVERIRELEAEWIGAAEALSKPGRGTYEARPKPIGTVWCGDFNFPPDDPSYLRMGEALAAGRLRDAWVLLEGAKAHQPTCGIFDRKQWPQGPHARDYFFVSESLAASVQALDTNVETDASDHQPVRLTLAE